MNQDELERQFWYGHEACKAKPAIVIPLKKFEPYTFKRIEPQIRRCA